MRRELTKSEQESYIWWNEDPDEQAELFTYNEKWQRHFEKVLKIQPIETTEWGARVYRFDKKRIPLPRLPKNLTDEQRKKIGLRLVQSLSKNKAVV